MVLAAIRAEVKSHYGLDPFYVASDRLRDDKEVALASLKVNPYTFESASKRLRADKEVVLETLVGMVAKAGKINGTIFDYITDEKLASDMRQKFYEHIYYPGEDY